MPMSPERALYVVLGVHFPAHVKKPSAEDTRYCFPCQAVPYPLQTPEDSGKESAGTNEPADCIAEIYGEPSGPEDQSGNWMWLEDVEGRAGERIDPLDLFIPTPWACHVTGATLPTQPACDIWGTNVLLVATLSNTAVK